MVWHLLKYWNVFILAAFYKRIQIKNLKNLQVKGPVIIAMNHPNAFTDPIGLTYVTYPLRLKYLARGDAFKPGLLAWLLEQIGIVPIYRIQDGGLEGLKKNEKAYERVNHLLKKNFKIIVFAEGICVQERRLRPLKKGVARMVFGAYETLPHNQLTVVPIGVNYSKPNKFRSTIFYNVGEPIYVKDFEAVYKENPAKANNLFLQALEPKMKELITHINDKNYDQAVYFMEALCKRNWLNAQGLDHKNLSHDFQVSHQITTKVNEAVENKTEIVDEFMRAGSDYFKELDRQGLKDWLVDPKQNASVTHVNLAVRCFFLALGLPIYLLGLTGNYLPYRLAIYLTKKILKKNVEFYSSIFIGLAMALFLINYVAWFLIVYVLSPTVFYPLAVCTAFALSAWFSLQFHPYILKARGMRTILKNKHLGERLSIQREGLMKLVNQF